MTSPLAAATRPAGHEGDERAALFWDAITPGFLAVMSWDPDRQTVTFPQDHPLLGWQACRVVDCHIEGRSGNLLCPACELRWASAEGASLADFIAIPRSARRGTGTVPCAVDGCQRTARTTRLRLCIAHDHQRNRVLCLPLEEFLAHPDVIPLASFGPCKVATCTRDRTSPGNLYCSAHATRFRRAKKRDPNLDVEAWERTVPPPPAVAEVSLRALAPLVVAEILYGLQQRTESDIKTNHHQLRPFCHLLRKTGAASVTDIASVQTSSHTGAILRSFVKSARRLEQNPETERHKDSWDLFPFGHAGSLTFTEISQPWLREATKRWAFEDLPLRRGNSVASITQAKISAIVRLSESLRVQRPDHGNVMGSLSREDITAFCNRMAFLAEQGQISEHTRRNLCNNARLVLDRCRTAGLTRSGQPLHGLPDDFAFRREDIPEMPEDDEAGKDLPPEVMRFLASHLDELEAAGGTDTRVAVEIMMDTGRRPEDTAALMLDCLASDPDGKLVLIYDNIKAHRKGRRLPIAAATAAVITAQQDRVRARFPGTPDAELRLFPAPLKNPGGRRKMPHGRIGTRHRDWVDGLPEILVPTVVDNGGRQLTKMLPFDKERINCKAYRHTYAQRHADAGVDVTVLQELMDHRRINTTQTYYRVGAERRREAVDRVTAMQFDRHGNRVWRQAGALLDSEHTRKAVGEVAVPYGRCSEPSNVAADGQDCSLRFRCMGCGHFSTDISYLPDMERYLADLLRQREKLRAMADADEWARAEAMPSDNEVTRIRRLISRMKSDLDDLADAERSEIEEAVATVRRGRATITHLGMPGIRQPLPDIRAERGA